jgi:antirestriction protein ArdC
MKRDLYAEVSARIVAELERGAVPWVKPWSATAGMNTPCNAVTNRPYSGCNVVLLWMAQAVGYRAPRYLTFKRSNKYTKARTFRQYRHDSRCCDRLFD